MNRGSRRIRAAPEAFWNGGALRMLGGAAVLSMMAISCSPPRAEVSRPAADPSSVVRRVLRSTPLVDGHNDVLGQFFDENGRRGSLAPEDFGRGLPGQTDLPRLVRGEVGGLVMTVANFPRGEHRDAGLLETTAFVRQLVDRDPRRLQLVTTARGIRDAHARGAIGLLLALEGGDQIHGSVETLRAAHGAGVRSMTLVWERTNALADAHADARQHGGLSPFGRAIIAEMNRLGMVVDLSHASDETSLQALDASVAPVVFSHSGARAVCDSSRNLPDEVLRRVAARGGVVMVSLVPYFTTDAYRRWYEAGEAVWATLEARLGDDSPQARDEMKVWEAANPEPVVDVADVVRHIEHVRSVAGGEHVGLGSDFDGMFSRITGAEDASTWPRLLGELARRGWSEDELRALAGENYLRVLRDVERVAAELRADDRAP